MSSPSADADFLIDLASQAVFPLGELPDHAPRRRGGKRLHVATAYRWAKDGARAADGARVRLPTLRVGGTLCTSAEGFQWFCERLSARTGRPAGARTPTVRRRELERADRDLDRLGV